MGTQLSCDGRKWAVNTTMVEVCEKVRWFIRFCARVLGFDKNNFST